MKTYQEWMKSNHPETYNEINWKNTFASGLTGATLAAGSMGLIGNKFNNSVPNNPTKANATSDDAGSYIQDNKQNGNSSNLARLKNRLANQNNVYVDDNERHWNADLGNYTTATNQKGEVIYKTKNGNYKMKKDMFGNPEYTVTLDGK